MTPGYQISGNFEINDGTYCEKCVADFDNKQLLGSGYLQELIKNEILKPKQIRLFAIFQKQNAYYKRKVWKMIRSERKRFQQLERQ